ncbi:MAG: ABC transporter permease, partial [Bacilli bacterium]|nr:ABC transporter permease [Bacilli bacterium]
MYSLEHKKYLKNLKLYKFFVKFIQILLIILFVIIWQISADNEWINTFIYSSPKAIIKTILILYQDGTLFYHIGITFYEVIISFVIGSFIGLFIATLLWKYKFLAKVLDPYLTVLNSLPKVSLGPIIIIIAGAGTFSIILMALLISVIITIMNVYQAFTSTDKNKIRVMKSFKASDWQLFLKLILPSNVSNIINTFKVNISLTFIGVIMGEFLVSKAGVGYLIMYGSQIFNLNLVFTGIILLSIMASFMYYLI